MNNLTITTFPALTTENLTLRQLSLEDENEIFALRSDLNAVVYLDRPLAETIEDARNFILKITDGTKNNDSFFWGIVPKGEIKLAGTICLWNISEDKTKAEIGYELLPAYQGKGIMQEAITEIINFSFNTLKLQIIEAVVTDRNLKSIKVLERNGFVNTGREELGDNKFGHLVMPIYELKKPG